jgi:undecaprenyl-diphosphatase
MDQLSDEFWRIVSYLILGLTQGVTEVFPISSSAHLALTSRLLSETLGVADLSLQAAIVLHFGTFLAILVLYRQDVALLWHAFSTTLAAEMYRHIKRASRPPLDPSFLTPFQMLLSLVVTALIGLALKDSAEGLFQNINSIPALMMINGIIIMIVARRAGGDRRITDLNHRAYLLIGVAQGISVLPGISRFGMTLCAGLMCGLSWFEALKLSFLLSMPTFLGVIVLELSTGYFTGTTADLDTLGVLIGIFIAASSGYAAIRLLLKESLDTRTKFHFFGQYCIAVGLFLLIFFNYLPTIPS